MGSLPCRLVVPVQLLVVGRDGQRPVYHQSDHDAAVSTTAPESIPNRGADAVQYRRTDRGRDGVLCHTLQQD